MAWRAPVLVLAVTLTATACGSPRHSEPVAPPLQLTELEARGQQVFMANCNACHPRGEPGIGPGINDKPLPTFLMRFQVRNGLGAMPHFSDETVEPEELDALIAYLLALRRNAPRT